MSAKKPEPYAPDLFSEHARLAQLGARVLEILEARHPYDSRYPDHPERVAAQVRAAARSLGLLPEGEVRP